MRRLSRRDFVTQSAAAIAGLGLASCGDNLRVSSGVGLGIGVIGLGLKGSEHLMLFLQRDDVHVVAVADVEKAMVEAAQATRSGLAGYQDYRELLARSDIDAVVIATPDHWHAKIAIDAANAGKHVYCEKPLTLTIAEGRRMVEVVRANNIALQTGTQLHSLYQYQLACEVVRNGRIGQLTSIETAVWPGMFQVPLAATPQPSTLDWDMFLGSAPEVAYHQLRAGRSFRYFRDYGGGAITDFAAHNLDIAQCGAGYDRSGPTKVRGTGVLAPGNTFETPTTFDVTYTYDNGVTLHLATTDDVWWTEFFGTEGSVRVDWNGVTASRPEILDYQLGTGPIVISTTTGHYENWFEAIANGTLPICDVEIGHRVATLCHLANISIDLGRELTWDPAAEMFVGDAEANARISRPRRAPWML